MRWLVIIAVVLTYPLSRHNPLSLAIIAVLIAQASYNLLRFHPPKPVSVITNSLTALVVDDCLLLMLLVLTGGFQSAYWIFFLLIVLTASYLYGFKGVMLLLAIDSGIIYLLTDKSAPIIVYGSLRFIVAQTIGIIAMGLLVERLTRADRLERAAVKRSSNEADSEKQRLLALLNSLTDAVVVTDESGNITLSNGAAGELLGSKVKLSGRQVNTVLPLITPKNTTVALMDLAGGEQHIVKRDDFIYVSPDGTKINLDITISPVKAYSDGDPAKSGYIFVIRDVTKAKSLDEQRSEFISVASHELRTPLTIAEANISTALLPTFGQINPEAKELLHQAHRNIIFLADLIKDLTTLARAEEGVIPIDIKRIDPAALIDELARDYRAEAADKGLAFKTEVKRQLPQILTSEYRIQEILQNLLTNAIKYTKTGSISLSVKPGSNPNSLIFSVADTGVGISDVDKKHIFSKFYRSEDFRNHTSGTGLGLYIAHKLAERINARIWFESRLNKGSVFYVEIPPFKGEY